MDATMRRHVIALGKFFELVNFPDKCESVGEGEREVEERMGHWLMEGFHEDETRVLLVWRQ